LKILDVLDILEKITILITALTLTLSLMIMYYYLVNEVLLGLIILLVNIYVILLVKNSTKDKKLFDAGIIAGFIHIVLFLIIKTREGGESINHIFLKTIHN